MQFGVQIGTLEWQESREMAQKAEALGYDSVMMPDHLVHEGPEKQHDPTALSYDPILQVGLMAAATKKVKVGHLVLCNLFRHPVMTAQAIISLDHLSGGRAFLGLGTGWTETEFRMMGMPFPDIKVRLRMLDEALTCIRGLFTEEQFNFEGEFYQFKDAIFHPKPLQKKVPIVLGGSGKGMLRIAAKHADVINIIADVGKAGYIALKSTRAFDDASFKERVRFLREETARVGRDPKAVKASTAIFSTVITDSPEATKSMAESFSGMFGVPPDQIGRLPVFLLGTPDECAAELARRIKEWELEEIIFSGNRDGGATMERLAKEVIPQIR